MDYPSDFDTPAFPAGPRIAISRFMAIASCVLFVIIIFACIVVLWAAKSQRVDPFVVSVDELTGEWIIVGHSHGNGPVEISAIESLQQSVVGNFMENWFTISGDTAENDARWQTCNRSSECSIENNLAYSDNTCVLYCASGEDLFTRFIYNIVPDYQTRVLAGEEWVVDKMDFQFEPAGQISNDGGTWRITATIQSNISGNIDIVAFAKVARNLENYPQTFGFYVADFNAYKIN